MQNRAGKLYFTGKKECVKIVDLAEYADGDLPTVIVFQGTCFVYNRITERGTVAEYYSALTLRLTENDREARSRAFLTR